MDKQIKDTPCGCDGRELCSWHKEKYDLVSHALNRRPWTLSLRTYFDEDLAIGITKATG